MSNITIYDSEGNEYSSDGESTETNPKIKQLLLSSIQLGVYPDSNRIVGYFNASKTENSRTDQFYADYTHTGSGDRLLEFSQALNNVTQRLFANVDTDSERNVLFRYLNQSQVGNFPGDRIDKTALRNTAAKDSTATIGVSRPEHAIGIIKTLSDQFSVAISDNRTTNPPEEFDVAIHVQNTYQGIVPVGDFKNIWDQERQSARDDIKQEYIAEINQKAKKLRTDFGMDGEDILKRVSHLPNTTKKSQIKSKKSKSSLEKLNDKPQLAIFIIVLGIVLVLILLQVGFLGPQIDIIDLLKIGI
jgi:hypothetical protein